jgi:predicted nucleic-acid-binding protein
VVGAITVIGIDTNILVRFLVDDEPVQNEKARRFLSERNAEDPAYVSAVVVAESVWILNRRLKYPLPVIAELLQGLLAADGLVVEFTEELDAILSVSELGTDLADYLVAWSAWRAGCRSTITFDKNAAARVPGMELLT